MDQETKDAPEAKQEKEEVKTEPVKEPVKEPEKAKENDKHEKPADQKIDKEHEKIEELEKKNKELEEKVAVLKNEYAKAYADTENMRKRLNKEHESFVKYHMQDFAKEVLPVLDNCERALAAKSNDEALRKGVEMIYSQLKSALEKEGVTEIDALGKPFDGNWHQALMSEPKDGVEPGIVIEVLQKGYKLNDRIVRAAMVKVSD
jgi:molecular chaperone GrpE